MYAGDLLVLDLSTTREWVVVQRDNDVLDDSNGISSMSIRLRQHVSDDLHALIQETCSRNGWMIDLNSEQTTDL